VIYFIAYNHSIKVLLSPQTNTFQCLLATDGVESFVIYLYAHERIQWTTGDYSGTPAIAGINAGDGYTSVSIPGSGTPDIINIDETSNVGMPGVWMFQVGEGTVTVLFVTF